MGLFKKKKPQAETAPENAGGQSGEYKALAAEFLPEEFYILAVTGLSNWQEPTESDSAMKQVTIGLTAWMNEDDGVVHQEEAALEAVVDDRLLQYLYTRAPGNSLLSIRVRGTAEGDRFLMLDLPTPGADPQLKQILLEQVKPVDRQIGTLGTFFLNRNLGWFEMETTWLGEDVFLAIDQDENSMESAQITARTLMDNQNSWDERIRSFAFAHLQEELAGRVEAPEGFDAERLEPDTILDGPDGKFEVWLRDGLMELTSRIHVIGTLTDGPECAELEE